MAKSRVLVVGATGDLGKFLVQASLSHGHPTFFLQRPGATSDAKHQLRYSFVSQGVITLHGDLDDHASLVVALKQVDVVISAVDAAALLDGQLKLIKAIKQLGHIKPFVPSEFGNNVERPTVHAPSLVEFVFEPKRVI